MPAHGRRAWDLLLGRRAVGQDGHVFAVVAAVRAYRVRPLQLTAVLALDVSHRGQCVMGAAHVAARLRNLLLGYSHDDLHDGAAAGAVTACPKKLRPRSSGAAGRLL